MKLSALVILTATVFSSRMSQASDHAVAFYSPFMMLKTQYLLEDGYEPTTSYAEIGAGAEYSYYFIPTLAATAHYQVNANISTISMMMNGFGAGIKYYVTGSARQEFISQDIKVSTGAKYNFFTFANFTQRSYDFTVFYPEYNTNQFIAETPETLVGTFYGIHGGVGLDFDTSSRYRVGARAAVTKSVGYKDRDFLLIEGAIALEVTL